MSKTVLLVDDEADIVQLMKRTLETRGGYRVLVALSGVEALALLREHRPDLIVIDVMMPEMCGLDLCQEIALFGLAPNVPLMLLTALSDRVFREEYLLDRYDVSLCMYKPFDSATLLENVRRAIASVRV
ncbi:MAG: response regulator [Planctomycetes bacterium]|nr:response regulator [Planctomycetota bacterium]